MRLLTFTIIAFIFSITSFSQNIVINEFCSSNSTIIADENDDYEDWIELYNPTSDTINLAGWGLSDNESKPYKWVFPDITIKPNEYLLLFASGKDIDPNKQEGNPGLLYERYDDITGGKIEDLLNSEIYPDNPTSSQIFTNYFESPVNQRDYFGHRMQGAFVAPQTGYYIFWISSDDSGQLYLSSETNFEDTSLIAENNAATGHRMWNKYESQQSDSIYLEEGETYHLKAISKEGTRSDHFSVGWQLPDKTLERPIPAHYFTTYFYKNFHTNFSISAEGEPLILTDNLGNTVHYIPEISLPIDVSYGLKNDGSGFRYFTNPTPGAENSDNSFEELSFDQVEFSRSGGFYSDEFLLELSFNNPNAKIYYTLDGSEPSPNNLEGTEYSYATGYPFGLQETAETKSYLYTEPIEIKDVSNEPYQFAKVTTNFASQTRLPKKNIFKGTVVRAVAVADDIFYPSIVGNSYFITNEVDKYDLPVVSIITDPAGLFDYEKGIYVPGKIMDEWRASNTSDKHNNGNPANYSQNGIEWDRYGQLNYFDNSLLNGYDKKIKIKIHGGWTRAQSDKSFRIYAKNKYDLSDVIDYPFFNDLKDNNNKAITTFNRLLLRTSGNDLGNTRYRDALTQGLLKHLPLSTQAYSPLIQFVNGEYWGIINLREGYDKYYFASHFNVDIDDVAILYHNLGIDEGYVSDINNFQSIIDFSQTNDLQLSQNIEFIDRHINIESLIQYFAAEMYIANKDWPHNNQRLWRYKKGTYSKEKLFGIDGRWNWVLYDTDFGFGLGEDMRYTTNEFERIFSSSVTEKVTLFLKDILVNDSIQNFFSNIVSDQINSCFKPDYVHSKVDEFNSRLASSRAEHYNRWRSGVDEGESIKTFASERPAYMREHTREHFNLGEDINIIVNKQGSGKVQINSLLIDENLPGISDVEAPYPWSGVYYTDVPIKLKAVETATSLFSHWEGDIPEELKNDREIELPFSESSSVMAVFKTFSSQMIHYWHFNDLPKNELFLIESDESNIDINGLINYPGDGIGYMDRVKEGTDINAYNNAEDGNALRVRNPSDTRSLQVNTPTNGYERIKVSYAVARTNKGSEHHSISYKTSSDDVWTLYKENIVSTESFRKIDLDFSDIGDANNNEDFALRIDFTGEAASGESGNNRFDNILVTGSKTSSPFVSTLDTDFVDVKLYPNPVRVKVNIVSTSFINSISVYDIRGNKTEQRAVNDYSLSINVNNYSQGVYVVKIVSDSGVKTMKFVVE